MSGQFPRYPVNGQEYIDVYNVKWIYTNEHGWVKVGPIVDVPAAKSGTECQESD